MIKVAFSGKANSGKDTAAKLFMKKFKKFSKDNRVKSVALADPIKEMIRVMFPRTKRSVLYGPSKNRMEVVPGAFFEDQPLTYRKLLQNLGTEVGRGYKETIWLDVMDYKIEKAENNGIDLFIVKDCRFINEIFHLKKSGFLMIRVKRNEQQLVMGHASEVEQELIKDSEFDYIIDNNSTLDDLSSNVEAIVSCL